jgi:pyruvate/2-oxoglutarate dehydrogenase complex dihydrolipoamide dehydrogenase (E3) component
VQRADRLLPREDKEFSTMLHTAFQAEDIELHLACTPQYFAREKDETVLYCQQGETTQRLVFDAVLLAVGRQPNVENLGLDNIGIDPLSVNATLQTQFPNIYACGDVVSQYQFTHAAAHQAWHAAVNALFGHFKQFKVDERFIPWATFCEPEIARVGLNEQTAQAQNIAYEVSRYDIADLDRAITDETAYGQIKVLTVPNKDTILGVTIAGEQAGELIAEYTQAMQHGLGLNKILSTIHIYPTLMEANKYVAGQWKRAHQPTKIMGWLAAYQRWRRS